MAHQSTQHVCRRGRLPFWARFSLRLVEGQRPQTVPTLDALVGEMPVLRAVSCCLLRVYLLQRARVGNPTGTWRLNSAAQGVKSQSELDQTSKLLEGAASGRLIWPHTHKHTKGMSMSSLRGSPRGAPGRKSQTSHEASLCWRR